jgi:hypothetical protein
MDAALGRLLGPEEPILLTCKAHRGGVRTALVLTPQRLLSGPGRTGQVLSIPLATITSLGGTLGLSVTAAGVAQEWTWMDPDDVLFIQRVITGTLAGTRYVST